MKLLLNYAPNLSPDITETDQELFYVRSNSLEIGKQSNTTAEIPTVTPKKSIQWFISTYTWQLYGTLAGMQPLFFQIFFFKDSVVWVAE